MKSSIYVSLLTLRLLAASNVAFSSPLPPSEAAALEAHRAGLLARAGPVYYDVSQQPDTVPDPAPKNETKTAPLYSAPSTNSSSRSSAPTATPSSKPPKPAPPPKPPVEENCGPALPGWAFTPENWKAAKVDENIQTFINGGVDTEGMRWPKMVGSFAHQLGIAMLNTENYNCSLENPCKTVLNCEEVGRPHVSDGGFTRSKWGYFALNSLQNLNSQMSGAYASFGDAEAGIAARVLDMQVYGKKPPDFLNLRNALLGIGAILGVAGGLFPLALPSAAAIAGAVGATSGALPAIGGFFAHSTVNVDANANAKQFGTFIASAFNEMRKSLDFFATDTFEGRAVNGVYLYDLLFGGVWAQPQIDVPISDIANKTGTDLLARGVNSLWTKSKIYVTFVDLLDDASKSKCTADISGPQVTKYCADGGVYYLYRFDEDGHHRGHLDKPWGMDELNKIDLQPAWATEGSAKSFRVSQKLGGDGYNYDQEKGTDQILRDGSKSGIQSLADSAGRLAGSWDIAVCDMGTWGKNWNYDYVSDPGREGNHPMPCMCGPGGKDTAAFAKKAQMENFDTLPDWCGDQMNGDDSFVWPEGVTRVEYGWASVDKDD
ncbi:MAG: hypothetical protein M1817_000425 [Caeruleum heppii]|nr:MAG: hypothetical protein M1817_000425 [Caeruleum heppii]